MMNVSIAYILVVLIWSTTPLTVKWSSVGLDPMSGVFYRIFIAAAVGWVLLKLLKIEIRWDRAALQGYMAAVLGIFGTMSLVYWAATMIPSGLISVLFGFSPILTGLMAQKYLNEPKFTLSQWFSFLISIAGLVMLFGQNASLGARVTYGLALVLTAVIFFSVSGILVKRYADESIDPLAHTVGSLICSTPLFAIAWLVFGEMHLPSETKAIGSILYLSLGGSLLGFVCYYYVLKKLSATTVTLITLVNPVLALLLGQWLAGEYIGVLGWFATGLIGVGVGVYLLGGVNVNVAKDADNNPKVAAS